MNRIRLFWDFIINPKYDRINYGFMHSVKETFIYYLIEFLFVLIIMTPIWIFIPIKNSGLGHLINEYSTIQVILIAVIVVPIIEESIFRLPIIFKPIYLAISFSLLTFGIVSQLGYDLGLLEYKTALVKRLGISVFVALIIFYLSNRNHDRLQLFWKNNIKYIYFSSAIIFGFVHIGNIGWTWEHVAYFPIVFFPQLLSGFVFGFIRLRFGFLYAIIIHALNNFLPTLANISS